MKYYKKKKQVIARIEPLTFPRHSSVQPIAPQIQVIKFLVIFGFYHVLLLEREEGSKLKSPKCGIRVPAGGDTSYDVSPHPNQNHSQVKFYYSCAEHKKGGGRAQQRPGMREVKGVAASVSFKTCPCICPLQYSSCK
jgi:hypothetical protein